MPARSEGETGLPAKVYRMFEPRTPEEKLLLRARSVLRRRAVPLRGFFFGLQKGKGDVLITSRNVIENASHGLLHFHGEKWKDPRCDAPSTVDIELKSFENQWVKHPNDAIDLVALPSHVIDDAASKLGHATLDDDRVDHDSHDRSAHQN